MTCPTCKDMLGLLRTHTDCPVRASLWCSQCSCYGHLPSGCDRITHVQRPATLEELIPADVRERWGITTQTYIVWPKEPTLEDKEREIANTNTIVVRENDRAIRDLMKQLKIATVHAMNEKSEIDKKTGEKTGRMTPGNLQILRGWAVAHGKKIRLVKEDK